MIIRIKKLIEDIQIPAYAKPGDAGIDLRACESLEIQPGDRAIVHCGFAIEIPEGFCGLVIPRSGLAAKHGITVLNSPGLIDSGYRGEVCVVLLNTDKSNLFTISKGDRIAQLTIIEAPFVELESVDELDETKRGDAGFGSSGLE